MRKHHSPFHIRARPEAEGPAPGGPAPDSPAPHSRVAERRARAAVRKARVEMLHGTVGLLTARAPWH